MSDLVSNRPCPHCKTAGPHPMKLRPAGLHYADVRCAKCNGHFFEPKPDGDPTKYKRPASHTDLVKKFSRGFCEMCLKKLEELPKGQTLEAQHVVEFQDGGPSERENIWIVCTGCHKLIHWQRTYHGPRQEISERSEAIRSGVLPQPLQEPWESDGEYLERIKAKRQGELGL